MSKSLRWLAPLALLACEPWADDASGATAGGAATLAGAPEAGTAPCSDPDESAVSPQGYPVGHLGGFCPERGARVIDRELTELSSVEALCSDVLGPGCGVRNPGLRRLTVLQYRPEDGGAAHVELVVSGFVSGQASHAAFSDALLGRRDPLLVRAVALDTGALDTGGDFVLTEGRVLGWLGRRVIRLTYTNESQTLAERRQVGSTVLARVAKALAEAMPAEEPLPPAVRLLPEADRIPLGVRTVTGDALGVRGAGASAQGYYQDGDRRWRVLVIERPDVDSAGDVLSTLRRHPDSRKIKNAPMDALRFTQRRLPTEPHVEWVVGRRGGVIYGIGDEPTALPEFMSARDEARVKLSIHQKLLKLTRIHLR